jgi:hypothetical protein
MTRIARFAPFIALACVSAAHAADLPLPTEPVVVTPVLAPQWEVTIAPYLWAAGLNGDIGLFDLPEVEVDQSFADIFETLEFGAMAVTEIRYGRFGFFTDLMYAKTSDAAGTPAGILAEDVELESETLTFTAMGEYRVVDNPRGSFDVMAGGRLWSVDNEISFSGGVLDGVSADDGDTWIDPMIGARGRLNVTPKVFVNGWAMAGGFGVSSDFAWDLMAGVGYQFNDTFSTAVGYRALGVDYENDGFVFDMVQHGPILGLIVRF